MFILIGAEKRVESGALARDSTRCKVKGLPIKGPEWTCTSRKSLSVGISATVESGIPYPSACLIP